MKIKLMINDVDVADCEFYNNACNIHKTEYWKEEKNVNDKCEWHPNCYYKQLKRLEQENEELRDKIINIIKGV